MLKVILAVVALYLIAQFALDIDVKEEVKPVLSPLLELVQEHTEDTLPELTRDFLDNLSSQDLTELLESQEFDLSQLTEMIENQGMNLEQLSELIESQEFDSEAAKAKLEELKKLVQEKLEENQ